MDGPENKWNARWREKATTANWQADPWLRLVLPLLPRGNVLDIACGMGRNAIFLAEQGYAVTAVDMSEVALSLLDEEAQHRGLAIKTLQLDLESALQLPVGPFDLLLNFFYLHRPLLPQERARVRPGGVVVMRTFSSAGVDRFGPARPEISLRPGELPEIFSGWEVLLHEEGLEPSAKGGSLAGIVARRPD
jgi:SAM-dependent methyltransferase